MRIYKWVKAILKDITKDGGLHVFIMRKAVGLKHYRARHPSELDGITQSMAVHAIACQAICSVKTQYLP